MSKNYAAGMPVGDNQMLVGMNTPAPYKAVKQYLSENATASSVLTLTQDTTAIEVAAIGTAAAFRWVNTSDTQASVVAIAGSTSNFDHVVPANTIRRFVVPIETGTNTTFGATITSVQGQNREYGLFQRVAFKSQGIASVAVMEFSKSNSY